MPRARGRALRGPPCRATLRCETRATPARDALRPLPRAPRFQRAPGSLPSRPTSHSPRRRNASGLVAFTFEFGDPRFELGKLLLRALEKLLLNLEVLAQHQVEPREARGEHRLQVLLDVLRGRIAERLADALVQLVEKSLVDHEERLPHRSRARRNQARTS